MNAKSARSWLTAVAVALALAAARCDKNVDLGVAPASDAGSDAADAATGADAGD